MAKRIKAITEYMPRIVRGLTAQVDEVAELISGRTSVNPGAVLQVLREFFYAALFFTKRGRAMNLPGLGTVTPSVKLDGSINITLRVDRHLLSELNKKKDNFSGKMLNSDMIGKEAEELVARWNEDHPDDPVV